MNLTKSLRTILPSVLALVLCLLHCSCEREITLEVDEKPQVAVECVLINEPVQTLRMCYTRQAAVPDVTYVESAAAELIDMTAGEPAGRFTYTGEGEWTLPCIPQPGHRYRLEVSVPGYGLISAEQDMPEIDVRAELWWGQTTHDPDDNVFGEEYDSEFFIAYHLRLLPEYTWIYAMNCDRETGERTVAENICTDFPYVDNFNLTGEVYSPHVDTVILQGYRIPYAVYPDLIGAPLHRRYLRVPHPNSTIISDKHWLIVSGDFEGDYPYDNAHLKQENDGRVLEPGPTQGYIVFSAVSEDYDRYLMESIRLRLLQESSSISDMSIFLRENIFSNICGGVGIFGARSEEKMIWSNSKTGFGG